MSIHKVEEGVYKIRWREGGRNKSVQVHGSKELAKKILRKKLSARDENRHLDVKREINFRMSRLIERYSEQYGSKKKSEDREKSILKGIRQELGHLFVREADGPAIQRWYQGLTQAKDTGINRNPADEVEVKRPDDQRERYLEADEIQRLKTTLDEKMYRKGSQTVNQTFLRLRLIVLGALTTGMRIAEMFGLKWGDLLYREELIAVRAKLKGGKVRYVPMPPELAAEFRRYPAILGEERIFPPQPGAKRERQRVDKSFETVLKLAGIEASGFTICGTRSLPGT